MFTTDLLSASLSFVKYFAIGGNTEQCSGLPYLSHWQQWKPGKYLFHGAIFNQQFWIVKSALRSGNNLYVEFM